MAGQMAMPSLILVIFASILSTVMAADHITSADVAAMIDQATNGGTTMDPDLNAALDQLAEGPMGGGKTGIEAALHQYETQNLPDPSIPPSLPSQSPLGANAIGNDGESTDAAPVGPPVPTGAFPPQKMETSDGTTTAHGPSVDDPTSDGSNVAITYMLSLSIITCFFTF